MTGKRALASVVAAALAVVTWAAPAVAGFLSPVADRHEPGSEATLVGYVMPPPAGWEAAGPYMAFFKEAGPLSSQVRIGPLDVAEVDTAAGRALRVTLVFRIPPDAAPAYYEVTFCDRTCTGGLGDLAGSHPLNVGVDPAGPIVREWARNEPEIANLPGEAVVSGPGFRATAAELRRPAVPVTTLAPTPPTLAPPTAPPPSPAAAVLPASAPPPTVALAPAPASATAAASAAAPDGSAGNAWFVVLGIALALACTAAVLVARRAVG